MGAIRKIAAYILLVSAYGLAWGIAVVGRAISRRRWTPTGRIVVTGTFFNPNWYLSHITPLVRSGLKEVILVADEPQKPIEGVRCACPPRWLARLISRAGAKAVWMLLTGLRHRPDLYMGYHIFPGAISALVVARLLNRPACYQDTSGPLELAGGGWGAENRVLAALGGPSSLVESLLFRVVRQFDLVVVRGTQAETYIRRMGHKRSLAVITGSVDVREPWREQKDRGFDLVFVGRLAGIKRPDRFVSIVAAVARRVPGVRALVIGDGPDRDNLKAQAQCLGIQDRIEFLGQRHDVLCLLSQSKTFVLTSEWEGLSIAMIEAMAAGAVPVVSDVGDLGDLVSEGDNGFVVSQDATERFSEVVVQLVTDECLWRRCSRAAVAAAEKCSGVEAVSEKWRTELGQVIRKASDERMAGGSAVCREGPE